MKEQRRGRKIAMSPHELDRFLGDEHTCRVATVKSDGAPHVTPLWFVWDGESLWLHTLVKSQRWTDLERDPRVAVIVDAGVGYEELRGAELSGRVERVGEIPRTGLPNEALTKVESLFGLKYRGTPNITYDGKHAWLRLSPEKTVTWDFRKIPPR